MAANLAYMRKVVSDELWDTLFFASGERPEKERGKDSTTLRVPGFADVKVHSHRKIYVNGEFCRYSSEAKYVIQEMIK